MTAITTPRTIALSDAFISAPRSLRGGNLRAAAGRGGGCGRHGGRGGRGGRRHRVERGHHRELDDCRARLTVAGPALTAGGLVARLAAEPTAALLGKLRRVHANARHTIDVLKSGDESGDSVLARGASRDLQRRALDVSAKAGATARATGLG